MSLPKGVYNITSKRTTGVLPDIIGRFPIEDLSLLPKGIFALPDGVRPHYPHWAIEPQGDKLKLSAIGAVVAQSQRDGSLAAYLIHEMAPSYQWVATPTGEDGCYTIELPDKSKGWVVSDQETSRGLAVEVKKLSGRKEDKEVFIIARLDE